MIKLAGKANLMNNPEIKELDPNTKQSKFSLKVNSTVFIDLPPYLTIVSWMMMVLMTMIKNIGLLKKFSKTFVSSGLSFLALI